MLRRCGRVVCSFMKKTIKKLPESKIEIEVEIPANEWESFLNEAARELSHSLKIDGFRQGSAPRNIVEREVGLAKIMERGSELAVRKTYVNIIIEDKIEAIGQPKIIITKLAQGNPLVFKAEVVVLPEIKLPDYAKIAKEKKPKTKNEIKISEEEINKSLEWLQKSRAKFITVLREAKMGDRVEVDFEATLEGKKVENGESKNHPLILGQSRFIKGFDENLIGLKEGEEKNFSLVFPDDYQQEDLAGKLVDFKVKMNLVQEQELPELNDEFAKSLGSFENKEKLKENIKQGLLLEKETKEKQDWREEIINKIADKSTMELPGLLIDQEAEQMIREIKAKVSNFGLPWEKYLESIKKTEEEVKKEIKPQAEKRTKAMLILREIGKKENIEVSDEELDKEMSQFLGQFPDGEEAKHKIDTEQLKEYTYGIVRNEKVFEMLEKF